MNKKFLATISLLSVGLISVNSVLAEDLPPSLNDPSAAVESSSSTSTHTSTQPTDDSTQETGSATSTSSITSTSASETTSTQSTGDSSSKSRPAFEDFTDVPVTHPYYNAIIVLRYQGLLNGYPDNTFKPDQALNRVEALKLIFEVASISLTNGIAPAKFTDTEMSAWYSGYLNKAVYLEVVGGYPDGTFRPAQSVNLVEFLKMLLIAQKADLSNVNLAQIPYSDVMPGQWYSKYINYAKINDLLKADNQNRVFPDQPLTRGRAADIIYRFRNMKSQPVSTDSASDSTGSSGSLTDSVAIKDFALYVSESYKFAIQYPKIWFYSSMDNLDASAIRTYGFGPKNLESNPPAVTLELLPDDKNFQPNLISESGFSYFKTENDLAQTVLSAKINNSSRIYRITGSGLHEQIMLTMLSSLTVNLSGVTLESTSN